MVAIQASERPSGAGVKYDLLKTDLALELAKRPDLLREQLGAQPPEMLREPVVLDEVCRA